MTDPHESQMRRVLADLTAGRLDNAEAARRLSALRERARAENGERSAVVEHLRALVAQHTATRLTRVRADIPLDRYGFDSVMAVDVVRALAPDLGDIPVTTLFEVRNLDDLADHLAERYSAGYRRLVDRLRDGDRTAALGGPPAPSPATDRATGEACPHSGTTPSNGQIDAHDGGAAVIGLAGRFPGATSVAELWDVLAAGRDCITTIPSTRWDWKTYAAAVPGAPGTAYARWGGFVDDVEGFDADFFRISPKQARFMDPQERLLLQEVWHALEDAALPPRELAGQDVGVYVGVMYSEYGLWGTASSGPIQYLGSSYASIANRVSHTFDLRGPSIALDTMCSSSLTALDLACAALDRGEIDVAIVAGVNLNVHPRKFVDLSQGRFASTDGRCRAFGAGGDGYVPGEAVVAAVLRRADDAARGRRRPWGVIRAVAVGHGGRTNGFSTPNPTDQQRVIRRALGRAGIEGAQVGYVEAHGTGTGLGDPIEVGALSAALDAPARPAPCPIGSVKSNVGHCEAAAGLVGLTKVLLQMRHAALAPSLHSEVPNPALELDARGLAVQQDLADWAPITPGTPRTAGLSSFGAGGANAHVVIQEPAPIAPPVTEAATDGRRFTFPLSAATPQALLTLCDRLRGWVREVPLRPADVSTTLWRGREHLEHRCVVVASSIDGLGGCLRELVASGEPVGVHGTEPEDPAEELGRWVAGGAFDARTPPDGQLVELPGYPFQTVGYWHDGAQARFRSQDPENVLVRLDAASRHVADHVVGGRTVVAAAVLLDRVRRAVRDRHGQDPALGGCVWLAPVIVEATHADVEIEIRDGRFRVLGMDGTTHVEGSVLAKAPHIDGTALAAPPDSAARYDAQCCYARFAAAALTYGETYRVLAHVAVQGDVAWARLRESGRDVVTVLDGALQAVIALVDAEAPPSVPFAMERVDLGPDLASARDVEAHRRGGVIDIRLADDAGRVVGTITGLVVRPLPAPGPLFSPAADGHPDPSVRRAHLAERWDVEQPATQPTDAGLVAVVADDSQATRALLAALAPHHHGVTRVDPGARLPAEAGLVVTTRNLGTAADLASTIASYHDVLDPLVSLIASRPGTRTRWIDLRRTGDCYAPTATAAQRTLTSEADLFAGRTVLVAPGAPDWARIAAELSLDRDWGRTVQLIDGRREAASLEYRDGGPPTADVALRRSGVYVVTGALGGVGGELCLHLARSVGARLVLVGRRGEPEGLDALVAGIERVGGAARHVTADVSTYEGAQEAVGAALEAYGELHGVFHLAGVVRDSFAVRKRSADADAVLGSKALGALNLLTAVGDRAVDLDVLVCFGSASAYVGVPGQVDYAYANAALSGLALQASGDPGMPRVVTLEWPLLDVPGMSISDALVETLRTHLGWRPMPVPAVMAALDDALRSREPVIRPVFGDAGTITRWLDVHLGTSHAARAADAPTPRESSSQVRAASPPPRELVDHLAHLVGRELGLTGPVDPRRTFDRVGLESVMVMNLNRRLEEDLGPVPSTLFFQTQDVDELAAALWDARRDEVTRFLAGTERIDGGAGRPSAAPSRDHGTGARDASHAAPGRPRAADRTGPDVLPDSAIAVIGIAGRYPGARDVRQFWSLLAEGRDAVVELGDDRWDHDAIFDPRIGRPGKTYARWAGLLDDIDLFDAAHFGVSPREARQMDPQERIFLETAWHAMEDAGYSRSARSGARVGVFVGVMYAQYQLYGAQAGLQERNVLPSSQHAAVANRVSYAMDLHGPSMAVDTMCSSSLTALHLACQSLRTGESTMAIAGGVNVISHPYRYLQMAAGRFASTDGRCRSFGAGGTGYVPGEGVGAVVLKRLADAIADGDHIDAVLRGSALNHGGRTNGYTVPSVPGQADVIRTALAASGLRGTDLDYVEAHGTGTELGDPIEVAALGAGLDREPGDDLSIGSVKSNIGHLESAAGIAGLTKIILQMRHRELVPSLHSEPPNPAVDFGPFRVQRSRTPWASRAPERPRRAALSSFGAGGANAHVIVEEHLAPAASPDSVVPAVVRLSARTPEQLRASARDLGAALDVGLGDLGAQVDRLCRVVADVMGATAADIDPAGNVRDLGMDRYQADEIAARFAPEDHDSVARTLLAGASLQRVAQSAAPARDGLPSDGPRLLDVAHTLTVGRDDQHERVAFVVGSREELHASLRAFVAGSPDARTLTGRAETGATGESLTTLLRGPEGERFVDDLRRSGRLQDLARLWCAGHDIGWPTAGGRRVSLPGTVFSGQRHWATDVLSGEGQQTARADQQTAGGDQVSESPVAPATAPGASVPPDGSGAEQQQEAVTGAAPTPASSAVVDAFAPAERLGGDDALAAVRAAVSAVLEVPAEELDEHVPHSQFGVDSVLAVEIVDRIEHETGVSIRPTDFFAHPTIRALADHVAATPGRRPGATGRHEAAPETMPDMPGASALLDRSGTPDVPSTEVAVIGMSAVFPDAADVHEFWANLRGGVDSVREVPPSRWDVAEVFDHDRAAPGASYSKWAGLIERPDLFDADFFGISPREAQLMDPQHRLLLQESWRALENAGYPVSALAGSDVPVFVGGAAGDYHAYLQRHGVAPEGYVFMGTNAAILSSRVSYQLDLRGPSMTLDTSCSSSLLAIHLAAEAIREGRAEVAVAGGVALLFTPDLHVLASKSGMLSPTGRCRAFDSSADGFVPGEGAGAVVLKALDAAVRDGDRIVATIVASGTNQDGRSNGLTAPNMTAQRELESGVYRAFGVDATQIGYVECHGTGTRLGDPIEIEALRGAFGDAAEGSCGIGSVKSNIGHALTASGLAGFIKAAQCLEHRELVPTLHVEEANPLLELESGPFFVTREVTKFPAPSKGRRFAAVSAFGFSGTNVHVVLGEAPAAPRRESSGAPVPVPLSAPTPESLHELAEQLRAHLERNPEVRVEDVAHTFAHRRTHLAHRRLMVASDRASLAAALAADPARDQLARVPERYATACERFLSGQDTPWPDIPGGAATDLPGTPFAATSHWPFAVDFAAARTAGRRRSLTLRPSDPLVADHVVAGRPVLPAAAHLGLVIDLVHDTLGAGPVDLVDCVWMRPVVVERPLDVEVALERHGEGWTFDLTSRDEDGVRVRYSRGRVQRQPGEPDLVDLDETAARCRHEVGAALHYHRFTTVGVRYGPAYTTVRSIRHGERDVLASVVRDPRDQSFLPAGLLDGAIQAVAVLHAADAGTGPQLPFAMDRVRVLHRPGDLVTVAVRESDDGKATIALLDGSDRPCVVIEAMSHRPLPSPTRLHVVHPSWTSGPLPQQAAAPAWPGHALVLAEDPAGPLARAVRNAVAGEATVLPLDDPRLDDGVETWSGRADVEVVVVTEGESRLGPQTPARARDALGVPTLHVLRTLATHARAEVRLTLVTVEAHRPDGRGVRPAAAQLVGLVRSVAKEHPEWAVRMLDVGRDDVGTRTAPDDLAIMASHAAHDRDRTCIRRGALAWTRTLAETPVRNGAPVRPPRPAGTYVVLGGAQGVGFECAVDLVERVGARVALLGRRDRDREIDERLALLASMGGTATYVQVDAADRAALGAALDEVRRRLGPVVGVYHSALVLRDTPVAAMSDARYVEVCRPKMEGLVNLAEETAQDDLDHFVVFSSAQSFVGNPGQGNYSAASMFTDAYVDGMRADGRPVRLVNWGYWGDVGVVAHPRYRQAMEQQGVGSITAMEGMRALRQALASDEHQSLVVRCTPQALAHFGRLAEAGATAHPTSLIDADAVRELVAGHARMEELALAWARSCLLEAGVLTGGGTVLPEDAWQPGITPARRPLVRVILAHLRDADLLPGHPQTGRTELRALLVAHAEATPALRDQVRLLLACLDAYPDLLAGRRDATEVIFPGSSMHLVEGVYRSDPLVAGLNRVVADLVASRLRSGDRPLDIVEVGAGTGGTTSAVAPVLAGTAARFTYRYTDLSAAFLVHGRKQFGATVPEMRFERLDITVDPGRQGFPRAGQDLVLAANVLHTTPDLRTTLTHVVGMLREGGQVVLLETTSTSPFATLTFGLLEGWWLPSDDVREPGSPLASGDTWRRLLHEVGFGDVEILPSRDDLGIDVGQHVIVARRRAPLQHVPAQHALAPPSGVARTAAVPDPVPVADASVTPTRADVARRIEAVVARVLRRPAGTMDHTRAFTEYGIDSIILVDLVTELNAELGVDLGNTAMFDHPTIDDLAEYLASRTAAPAPALADAAVDDPADYDELALLEALACGTLTVAEAESMLEGRP